MNLSCQTESYSGLYARWMDNPGRLLDLAGWKPGERLLDLCGGSGAVTMEALRRGANPEDIILLDLNPRCPADTVRQCRGKAEDVGTLLKDEAFDVIVCRQAIGYLNIEGLGGQIRRRLRTGGRFVFNSFRRPRWALKTYKHEGRRFVEASGFLGSRVAHFQWCRKHGGDVTLFRWWTLLELREEFEPHFSKGSEFTVSGSSVRWRFT